MSHLACMWRSTPLCAVVALLLSDVAGVAAQSPLLTTQNGIILDSTGQEVILHGMNWFGFENGQTFFDMTRGSTSATRDFETIAWRIRQLGFNAMRLPFTFDNLALVPETVQSACDAADPVQLLKDLIPLTFPNLTLSNFSVTPDEPPPFPQGTVCNGPVPAFSVRERYLWTIRYFVRQGMYVSLDFHLHNSSLFQTNSTQGFVADWVSLVEDLLEYAPEVKGRIFVDLINEPDELGLTWEGRGGLTPLGDYYLALMDALWPICPDCLFFLEGTGATAYHGNWGDGFIIDRGVLAGYPNASDASAFLSAVVERPYINQVVISPHIYCAEASGTDVWTQGPLLWNKLSHTSGYLNKEGFCNGNSTCHNFTIVLGETGSTLDTGDEQACFASILAYLACDGAANDGLHNPITSWFFWDWQPNSIGTGGITLADFYTIFSQMHTPGRGPKVNTISGGTALSPYGLGLRPWYLDGFQPTKALAAFSSPDAAVVPAAGPTPAATPAPSSNQTVQQALSGSNSAEGSSLSAQNVMIIAIVVPVVTALLVAVAVYVLLHSHAVPPAGAAPYVGDGPAKPPSFVTVPPGVGPSGVQPSVKGPAAA